MFYKILFLYTFSKRSYFGGEVNQVTEVKVCVPDSRTGFISGTCIKMGCDAIGLHSACI